MPELPQCPAGLDEPHHPTIWGKRPGARSAPASPRISAARTRRAPHVVRHPAGAVRRAETLPKRRALSILVLAALALSGGARVHAGPGDAGALQGTLHLLPPGTIRADGGTQVLAALLLDAEGKPVSGATFRGSMVTLGRLGDAVPAGAGVYTLPYEAPASAGVREATLTLKARWPAGETAHKATLAFSPPAAALAARIEPGHLVLGRGDVRAVLSVTATGPGGGPATGLSLLARASAGSVGPFTEQGGGRYQATFMPPAENKPEVARIAVVDAARPEAAAAFAVLPLWGSTTFPLETGRANARLVFELGPTRSAPVVADAAGKAEASLDVPPGVAQARIHVENPSGAKEAPLTLDLNTAPPGRITFAPAPPYVPVDGRRVLPLRLVATDLAGRPDRKVKLVLSASLGTLARPASEGDGVFRVDWTGPALPEPGQLTVTAAVSGDPSGRSDSLSVDLVPAGPGALRGTITPWPPVPGTAPTVRAALYDADDTPSPLRDWALRTLGGTGWALEATPAIENGVAELTLPAGGPAVLLAAPRAHGRVPATLVALPLDDQLVHGGSVDVPVSVVDRFGLPVPAVEVRARVVRGSATVPAAATTDARGVAVFRVAAGPLGGVQELRFEVGGLADGVLLVAGRSRTDGLAAFPVVHGGSARAEAASAWKGRQARFDLGAGTTDLVPPPDAKKGK